MICDHPGEQYFLSSLYLHPPASLKSLRQSPVGDCVWVRTGR
jgi:hypothetical protein